MKLIYSIMCLGTFNMPLGKLNSKGCALTADIVDKVLSSEKPLLEQLYLTYITSFTHHYELDSNQDGESTVFRVTPSAWSRKFLYTGVLFIIMIMASFLAWGELDSDTVKLMTRVIIIAPMTLFSIPSLLGWLYYQYCIGKLEGYLNDS